MVSSVPNSRRLYKNIKVIMTRKQNRLGYCKRCNDKGHLSKRGLCFDCSTSIQATQQKQLKEKRGEHYDKWKKGILKGLNGDKTD